ncbi:MAG: LptF/LptG family permease, partial [Flavobacteriales bacterium]
RQPSLLPVLELTKVVDSMQADYDTVMRTLLPYYENTYSINQEVKAVTMDTILSAYFHLDSLLPQERKVVLQNAANRLENSVNYLDNRSIDIVNRAKAKAKVETEWHRKFTLSFACIVLFLVGAPLGAIVKKGGLGIPIAIAIVLFIVYYIISITGQRLGRGLALPPYIGMWLSSIVLLPFGLVLTYQAATESKIMDFEVIGNKLRPMISWIKKHLKKKV